MWKPAPLRRDGAGGYPLLHSIVAGCDFTLLTAFACGTSNSAINLPGVSVELLLLPLTKLSQSHHLFGWRHTRGVYEEIS